MGTKTVDEAGAEPGTEAKTDEEKVDVTKTDAKTAATDEVTEEATDSEATDSDELVAEEDEDAVEDAAVADSTGVGQGAGAVVAAVLGFVSLTGSWIGTVAGARQGIVGQLQVQSSPTQSVAKTIDAVYVDAWHTTAMWAGLFALAALVTGVVVLARPAFGSPARPQASWIKSVSWAGIALGVIGLLLAVLKYTDAMLDMSSVG
ncbi:hypothetical protein SAMN04487983_105122 [Streptomyces sp. yr375]|uniref:hypothetical protein n=1 Tax=Streptomyces sp. yr375 TaxID=1761906 RepID=UPI0008CEAE45|nr:hypothetical protein [Streptomyces sp. yr375]SES41565.1 hypothetical protein SAMN04487983_105122 [Streptomyces sp. yr375]